MSKDHMMTYPGLKFIDPFNPDPEQIDIVDIASSLGMLCRYGGHVPHFYSVAEHCVHMADHIFATEQSRTLAFAALMNDAPEAYIQDLIGPNKRRLAEYRALDDRFGQVIKQKYGIDQYVPYIEDTVSAIDRRMLRTEMDQMLGEQFVAEHFPQIHTVRPLGGVKLEYLAPEKARDRFLDAFAEYRT